MFLLIDKPKGITSHDVVSEIRKITGVKKVGHGGTLDPNATGLLIIGVGSESTKKLSQTLLHQDKTYEAEIILGEERETDDPEGKVRKLIPKQVRSTHGTKSVRDDKFGINSLPNLSNMKWVLQSFVGKQKQVPPEYSAKKFKGKSAYKYARKGIVLELKPSDVEIYSIKVIEFKYPRLKVITKVSSGTYIRSLARDIGRKLGTGAYLCNLRRTRIGSYSIFKASGLDEVRALFQNKTAIN